MSSGQETFDTKLGIFSCCLIIVTSAIWGVTDAALKYFSPPDTTAAGLWPYAVSLIYTPAYLTCLVLNQLGSVLYYYCLSVAPLSIVR